MHVFLRFSQDVVIDVFGKVLSIIAVVRIRDNGSRCCDFLLLAGEKFFAVRFDFGSLFVVGMPNLEEHLGEGNDSASFYSDDAVFPVSEPVMIPVDVFVGNVGATGKADFSVDIHNLMVVAVVQSHVEDGNHRHEFPGFDVQGFERLAKTSRRQPDGTDAVEEDAHLYAMPGAFGENFQNLIPESSDLNHKVIEEDETLRFYQGGEHFGKSRFAAWVICCTVAGKTGKVFDAFRVSGDVPNFGKFF